MQSTPNEQKRILIVDDEPVIAHTASRLFSKEGYDTRPVYSAEEALELISMWVPHLAVIDVRLPGMNGVDLAIRLKAELPNCKLVLLTGFNDPSWLHRGGHSFKVLMKPILPLELLKLASALLSSLESNA